MKHIGLKLISIGLTAILVGANTNATTEDTDVVPTSISMTEYCGITNVDPVAIHSYLIYGLVRGIYQQS